MRLAARRLRHIGKGAADDVTVAFAEPFDERIDMREVAPDERPFMREPRRRARSCRSAARSRPATMVPTWPICCR